MLYYIILIGVSAIIGLPILFLLFKLGKKKRLFVGMAWGALSILPYFAIHELARVSLLWKLFTLPAWLVFATVDFVLYDQNFFLHQFIYSYPFMAGLLVEIFSPVLSFIGPPLLGGFIVLIVVAMYDRIKSQKSSL